MRNATAAAACAACAAWVWWWHHRYTTRPVVARLEEAARVAVPEHPGAGGEPTIVCPGCRRNVDRRTARRHVTWYERTNLHPSLNLLCRRCGAVLTTRHVVPPVARAVEYVGADVTHLLGDPEFHDPKRQRVGWKYDPATAERIAARTARRHLDDRHVAWWVRLWANQPGGGQR
jgi:hypothetical protein